MERNTKRKIKLRRKRTLTFNLKKEWYEKIRSGKKTIEYREVKPYWTRRFASLVGDGETEAHFLQRKFTPNMCFYDRRKCKLRLGYTKHYMSAEIRYIEFIANGRDTDLHTDAPVYAIHLANVRECE